MVSLFIIHSHTIVIFPTKKHVPLLSVMQCTVRCFLLQKCNVIVQPEYILTQLKRERESVTFFCVLDKGAAFLAVSHPFPPDYMQT